MSSTTFNFLSLIRPAFDTFHENVAFRPWRGENKWDVVTYQDHHRHIAIAAEYFKAVISKGVLKQSDVVGIWVSGKQYEDIVHIMGIVAAGLVPQLFSSIFSPAIVLNLLKQSDAKALIIDPQFATDAATVKIPVFNTLGPDAFHQPSDLKLDELAQVRPTDYAVIVHSSGTTSGVPKLIVQSHQWVQSAIKDKWAGADPPGYKGQAVINSLGSLAHVGSFCAYVGAISSGACTVQASAMSFSTDELLAMIDTCGLNIANVYAPFGAEHIEVAKSRPDVLKALQSLRALLHTGVVMNESSLMWGYNHGITLQGYYGTSETGPLMCTRRGTAPADRRLHPLETLKMELVPFTLSSNQSEEHTTALFELVLPREAADGPHPSYYTPDGFYHTGDLFEEIGGDGWVYRGRTGDWIKINPGLIDTKDMEDSVRKACPDIVHDVVVVGQGYPMAVLLIESMSNLAELSTSAQDSLAETIVTRMADFNEDKFYYSRVDDPNRVIFVPKGSLPRNAEKGNIKRNAAETQYKEEIARIFASHN